jgi:hypothetical protein
MRDLSSPLAPTFGGDKKEARQNKRQHNREARKNYREDHRYDKKEARKHKRGIKKDIRGWKKETNYRKHHPILWEKYGALGGLGFHAVKSLYDKKK